MFTFIKKIPQDGTRKVGVTSDKLVFLHIRFSFLVEFINISDIQ